MPNGCPNSANRAGHRSSSSLFSAAPIYDDLETLKLADSLSMLVEKMGADNELVVKILAGKSPRDRAAELIHGTKLRSVEDRKKLAAGGVKAIEASTDPMIQLALLVDPTARAVRKRDEAEVQEPMRQAYAKIAAVRFALYGTNTYPDATFTLRLAFGEVKGYTEAGKAIPPWTTMDGAFIRSADHHDQEPFRLPASWVDHKDRARSGDADEFRFHRRHHRRQLRQPGGQPQRRTGRPDLRRQSPIAGARLYLQQHASREPCRSMREQF